MDEPVLKNLWDADVPASDPRFVLAVMARAEHRRFRRQLVTTIGLAAVAMLLLALAMPALQITWRESFAPYASKLTIVGTLLALTLLAPLFLPARD